MVRAGVRACGGVCALLLHVRAYARRFAGMAADGGGDGMFAGMDGVDDSAGGGGFDFSEAPAPAIVKPPAVRRWIMPPQQARTHARAWNEALVCLCCVHAAARLLSPDHVF